MVTKEQIHNLIDNSVWKIDPSRKVFNSVLENTEMFLVWDDNIVFAINGLREVKNISNKIDVITILYPNFNVDTDITLDSLNIDWENNNLQIIKASELKNNDELRNKIVRKNKINKDPSI